LNPLFDTFVSDTAWYADTPVEDMLEDIKVVLRHENIVLEEGCDQAVSFPSPSNKSHAPSDTELNTLKDCVDAGFEFILHRQNETQSDRSPFHRTKSAMFLFTVRVWNGQSDMPDPLEHDLSNMKAPKKLKVSSIQKIQYERHKDQWRPNKEFYGDDIEFFIMNALSREYRKETILRFPRL
jgi:hypothetical protein